MMNRRALQQFNKAYKDDALEAAVYGASPVGIIVMLYEGVIRATQDAKVHIAKGEYIQKAALINRAIDILEGLRLALDHEVGKEVTRNLEDLYVFAKYRLGIANLQNSPEILDEVAGLIEIILPAWQELAKGGGAVAAEPARQTTP